MQKNQVRFLCVFSVILLLLAASLTACGDGYKPPYGEVYTKTSPSRGDGGVSEVVDITVEKAAHSGEGEMTVPVKIGVGHLPRRQDGEGAAYLEVRIWLDIMPKEEPTDILRFEYPDWQTAAFNSTEEESRPWYLFWVPVYYGDFYPLCHETVEWRIPAEASYGFLEAELFEVDMNGNEYSSEEVRIEFERTAEGIVFKES